MKTLRYLSAALLVTTVLVAAQAHANAVTPVVYSVDQVLPNAASPVSSKLNAVSCPDATHCIAVGSESFSTQIHSLVSIETNGQWSTSDTFPSSAVTVVGAGATTETAASTTLNSVSCVTATFCMAGGELDAAFNNYSFPYISIYNGTTWSNYVLGSTTSNTGFIDSISCVTTTFCAVSGLSNNAPFVSTYTGTFSSLQSLKVSLGDHISSVNNNPLFDTAVSCATTTYCVAMASLAGLPNKESFSFYTTSWSTPSAVSGYSMEYLSCGSTQNCEALGANGSYGFYAESLTNNTIGTPAAILSTYASSGDSIGGLSCVGTSECVVAISTASDAIVATYTGGWTSPATVSANSLVGTTGAQITTLTCTSAAQCAAFGFDGSSNGIALEIIGGAWVGTMTATQWSSQGAPAYNASVCAPSGSCIGVGIFSSLPDSAGVSTLAQAAVPTAPTGLTLQASPGAMAATWTASSSNGGVPITSYTVTFTNQLTLATSTCTDVIANPEVDACSDTQLANATPYSVSVRATNAAGDSSSSAAVTATTPSAPSAPQATTATLVNDTLTVNWALPTSNGGSPITGYVATLSPSGVQCQTTALSCNFTLTSSGTYVVAVTAVNLVGTSAASYSPNVVIGDPAFALVPNFVVQQTSAQLTWTPQPGTSSYSMYLETPSGTQLASCTSALPTCAVTSLTPNTWYDGVIVAHEIGGANVVVRSPFFTPLHTEFSNGVPSRTVPTLGAISGVAYVNASSWIVLNSLTISNAATVQVNAAGLSWRVVTLTTGQIAIDLTVPAGYLPGAYPLELTQKGGAVTSAIRIALRR